jgi:hypothetical protein
MQLTLIPSGIDAVAQTSSHRIVTGRLVSFGRRTADMPV